jgi:SynChlorMet cassette radical SAM/SPASM protein ScmE
MTTPESAKKPTVMRMPKTVDIDLTSRCNLRCRYCYFFGNEAVTYKDLSTAEWLTFFDELGRLAVQDVCLAGGEPFIREDFRELIEGIVRNRMRFNILSNGGLITDEIAQFLASTRRCNYVQVSLDGAGPETHDACRGKGSFEAAVRGLKTLQRNKVNVACRVTITHHNVHELEAIARYLLEDLKLSGFGTNSAGYLGVCRTNARDVMLTVEDRALAMKMLLALNEKYGGRINAAAGPLAEGRMWNKMIKAADGKEPAFPNGGRLTACGCTSNKIAVRADGAIVPCNMLAHMVLGRVNVDTLQDVWLNHQVMNGLRTRRSIPLENYEFCADCEFKPYCTGNCPGLAYTITGKVDHPSPDACLRNYLRDGGELPPL